MTEIKIEKKKPVWPWILLILGIAALVYFLLFRDAEDGTTEIDEIEAEDTSELKHQSSDNTTYYL